MAHVVLTAVVSTVLNQLTTPALNEVILLSNCRNELNNLRGTISAIQDLLQDADERQPNEQRVRGWLSRLRVVMYDADDLLDEVLARALQKKAMTGNKFTKEVRVFFSKSNHLAFVYRTSHGVEGIMKSLDKITRDMERLQFMPIPHPPEDLHPLVRVGRGTHSFVGEQDVVGRENEMEDIINMLLANNEGGGISGVAIYGFGGLGKTTLAQLVYNNRRVKTKFNLCVWVCINYLSSLEKVLMEIIKSCRKKPRTLGLEQLQRQLRGIISGKTCLFVLDDVWDDVPANWYDLKCLLNCTGRGSKILITTRSKQVVDCLDNLKCYELNVLSKESAWSLFKKIAFKDEELVEDPDLESIGKEIVDKCGYVPLALITIGSTVRRNDRVERSKLSFLNQELSKVVTNGQNPVMQSLKISYNDLPANLKLCFAYCSLFPKDYLFEKDELVRLWLAQGFLEPNVVDASYEGGVEEYFFYLVERCFFQEMEVAEERGCRRYFCKMHDLLHDLAKEVAGTESGVIERVSDELIGIPFRHITLDCEIDLSPDYRRLFSESKSLRTLILSPKALTTNSLRKVLESFRMLRTLNLSCLELVKISKSVGELIHLRYLNLSGNETLKSLPNSICRLPHLQTLNLSLCKSLEKLPLSIGKLARLRYLILSGCDKLTFLPARVSDLTSLMSLNRLIVHQQYGGLRYLNRLDKLRGNLSIELPMKRWMNFVADAQDANMFKKDKLNGLTIEWGKSEIDSDQRLSNSEVEQVLEELNPHDNLQYLKITNCGAGKLPTWVSSHRNIEELILQCWHEIEFMNDDIISLPFFPRIQNLTIEDMDNLKGWWREEEEEIIGHTQLSRVPSLPRVSKVVIRRCPMLRKRMPLFPKIGELTLASIDREAVRQILSLSIGSTNRLKKLKLEQIESLDYVPYDWIRHLTALETLVVTSCRNLRWVSRGGLAHLTALEELKFEECGKVELTDLCIEIEEVDSSPWEFLQKLRVLELPIRDKHFDEGLRYLTSLEDLSIYSFEQKEDKHYKGLQYRAALDGIDIFDWLPENEKVNDKDEEVNDEDEDEEEMPWRNLEKLHMLTVGFEQKPWRFPKDIEYLRCLEHLVISDCRELRISWNVFSKLKELQSLTLCRVENVIAYEAMEAPHNNMSSLKFEECYMELEWMNEMPWEFFPSLHSLAFIYMSDLEHLPNGIQRLNSLQRLEIISCQNLMSLPQWMRSLTSLQSLVIAICADELKESCVEEETYRPHIIHIPHIHIL